MTDPRAQAAKAAHTGASARQTRYDTVSIALHWTTVALVLLLFALAETWGFFERPERRLMIMAHMSFGILLSAVILFRLAWRLAPGHRVTPALQGWAQTLSKGVHYLLYGLIVAQGASGFVLRWTGGEAMSFFGLALASPLATVSKPTHHLIGEVHEKIGWAIVILAAGHAAAALYHHLIVRDNVLRRMLPEGRKV